MNGKLTALAPAFFVFLWSTGFVAAKYGLPYADPFAFLLIRLLIATAILFLIALLMRTRIRLSRSELLSSTLIGISLHGAYLGGVWYAISVGLSAGVAAVITSLQPVLVSLFAIKFLSEKISHIQIWGLGIGFVGVILILTPESSTGSTASPASLFAISIALLGSTVGTLMQKKHAHTIPVVSGTAYQYLGSSLVLIVIVLASGQHQIDWDIRFIAALSWSVVVLSVGAIALLYWLLRKSSAAKVSSLLYLVPPVTAMEAFLIFGERVGIFGLIGIAMASAGVWLVIREPQSNRR